MDTKRVLAMENVVNDGDDEIRNFGERKVRGLWNTGNAATVFGRVKKDIG